MCVCVCVIFCISTQWSRVLPPLSLNEKVFFRFHILSFSKVLPHIDWTHKITIQKYTKKHPTHLASDVNQVKRVLLSWNSSTDSSTKSFWLQLEVVIFSFRLLRFFDGLLNNSFSIISLIYTLLFPFPLFCYTKSTQHIYVTDIKTKKYNSAKIITDQKQKYISLGVCYSYW